MKDIAGNWTGRITGTNNANIFVEVKQNSNELSGIARINDPEFGTAVYDHKGTITDNDIVLTLSPEQKYVRNSKPTEVLLNNQKLYISTSDTTRHGIVTVKAKIVKPNHIEGSWSSTIGTGGNVYMHNEHKAEQDYSNTKDDKERNFVFISYSHADKKHLKRLRVHLKPLEKEGVVDVWDDTKIKAGEKWEQEIENALNKSAIAVLIISADFLASDFIVDNELPPILERSELKGTKIVPFILRPCRFSRDKNLSKFQALNSPDKPLESMSENEQEELWDRLSLLIETELNR